ncbi:MAG: ammonium transporter [Puniceicoccales bacterium]|jgi:Amt family ammonium transporter|nr:ammonium transporter [Puniceicoccales bacterium]
MKLHSLTKTLSVLLLGVACSATLPTIYADEPAGATTTATPPPASAPATTPAAAPTEVKKEAPPKKAFDEKDLAARIADLEAFAKGENVPSAAADFKTEAGPLGDVTNSGNTAWMLTSTALVLFMTLPGLALFYGGLVRRKNVLSVLAQCMGIAGIAAILWWAVGFSLTFGGEGKFIGDFSKIFLKGVGGADGFKPSTLPGVPENVWVMFQYTFAVITPALIIGAIAERMKFAAVIAFVALWSLLVYYPFAHMVWGGGLIGKDIGAIDFAGGLVVHMSSGYSALVLAIILGPRLGFRKEKMAPHSMVLCMIGTAILWIGWYGFNAGSAGAANGLAGSAFLTTTLAAAIGGFTWAALEYAIKRQPSVLGFCSGIVAGLVVITPAAGFVDATGAVICGVAAGVIPYFACVKLKAWLGYDDALDTFGVHAVGGTVGTILTGLLAVEAINEKKGGIELLIKQLESVGIVVVWSVVATVIIAFLIKYTIGLRPTADVETQGLDTSEHGEEGYAG